MGKIFCKTLIIWICLNQKTKLLSISVMGNKFYKTFIIWICIGRKCEVPALWGRLMIDKYDGLWEFMI